MNNSTKGYLLMFGSALSFSIAGIFVKFLSHMPSQQVVFYRSIITLALSIISLKMHGITNPFQTKNTSLAVCRGISGALGLSLYFFAIQVLTLAEAATLQHMNPIFTAIFAVFIIGEKFKKSFGFILLIAFVGVILIANPVAFDFRAVAVFAGFLSAVFSGVSYSLVRKLNLRGENVYTTIFYFQAFSVAISLPFVHSFFTPNLNEWISLFCIGVLTYAGQAFLTYGLKYLPAGKATVTNYSIIVFSIVFSAIIFSQIPSALSFVGIFLIVGAISLSIRYK